MTEHLYLGVDGGGTGCRARIEDADGNVLGRGASGPASLRLGAEAVLRSITEAAGAAIAEAGLSSAQVETLVAGFGLAGLSRSEARDQLAASTYPYASVHFLNDAEAACYGANAGRDGAIVIAGTGSVGLGFVGQRALRVGGYGFPISDEGSGADIGLHAIREALKAHDGRRKPTPFLAEIMAQFQDDPLRAVAWMDGATATDYATLAPTVMHFARQRDPAATEIVRAAALHIETMIRALDAQGAPRITLLGGLAEVLSPWLSDAVRSLLSPAKGDAVSGAIIYARRAAS